LPLRQRQQQLQTTEQARREEQEKLETTLAQRRLAYKEKHQQFSDVKAICELEARIVGLEEERARLQPGAPVRSVVPANTRPSRNTGRWSPA
jgi:exonuclease SbcC